MSCLIRFQLSREDESNLTYMLYDMEQHKKIGTRLRPSEFDFTPQGLVIKGELIGKGTMKIQWAKASVSSV